MEGLTHHHQGFESRKNGAVTIGNKLRRNLEEEYGRWLGKLRLELEIRTSNWKNPVGKGLQ